MSIDARCYLFSYWRQIWKTLQLLINHLQYWAITNNAIIKQCNNWIIIRLLGEYVIWLLGKKGEGGENTKDRILDAAQIATKYTLQPECWVAVNTLGWILTVEKIRASLTIDRTFFFFLIGRLVCHPKYWVWWLEKLSSVYRPCSIQTQSWEYQLSQ